MTTDVSQPQPASAAKPSSFERIVGVFFSPNSTFESIARRPDVAIPLVILLLFSLVSGVLIARSVDWNGLARQTMEQSPQAGGNKLTPEQMDKGVRFTSALMRVSSYAQPFLAIIILAIIAGVLLIAFRIFGGEGDFKQAFSVVTYASYPGLIKAVIIVAVVMSHKALSIYELQNPVRSNLAFLVDPKTQQIPYALLTSLDVFTIWYAVLLIIGFAAVSRFSKARSAAVVISLWAIVLVFKVGLAALQAARMHT